MNLLYVPEMNPSDFKCIFKEYTEDIIDEAKEDWEQLLSSLVRQYSKFVFRNTNNLQVLSHVFGCNFSLNNSLQFFKGMVLWDWEKITSQKLVDMWFFTLKRCYGSQFPRINELSEEYIIEATAPEMIVKDGSSSPASAS